MQIKNKKRKLMGAGAILCAIMIVLSGAWAWQSLNLTAENNLKTSPYDVILHDVFNGVDQKSDSKLIKNGGARPNPVSLEDWAAGVDTSKQIYLENPSTSSGSIYVRVQLSETITGGTNAYAIADTIYKGDLAAPTDIAWTLGNVQDMAAWNGTDTGAFWLLDKTTGYAYWMQALVPGTPSAETGKFLNAIKLLNEQDEELTYTIKVNADAISGTGTNKDAEIASWATGANAATITSIIAKMQANAAVQGDINEKRDAIDNLITDPTSPVEEGSAVEVINGLPVIVSPEGDVYVIPENIPDNTVLNYINDNFATNGKLTPQDIDVVNTVTLDNSGVTDLTGIEIFQNLNELNVTDNPSLTSADVSSNPKLETLDISRTGVADINLENNVALTSFSAGSAKLESIDVSNNVNLEVLKLGTNNLTSIDVSKNLKLKDLQIHKNQLTSLNISNNVALEKLTCSENKFTSLNLSNNTLLSYMNAGKNLITSIDVSHNPALTDLRVDGNQLTSLDLSNNTLIEMLYAYDNQIGTLDVSTTSIVVVNNCRIQNNNMTSLLISTAQNAVTNFGKSSSYQKAGNPVLVVTVR